MPTLELADDHMRADLRLGPGERVSAEIVMALLSEQGVKHGIRPEALEALDTLVGPAMLPIAVGSPAQDGTDGRIEYGFRTGRQELRPQIGLDGRADYRNLGLVANVQPGQVLAQRILPSPGLDGRTVTGLSVKAIPGRDVRLRAGKGAELSEDGLLVRAVISGNPHLEGSVVLVREEYLLAGDVCLATGHVEFEGDLVIAGSVQQQMLVRATGDVRIHGEVQGGRIVAGGSIHVHRGVRHQAVLEAGGDIQALFVEGSRLHGGGSLVLKEDLLHSEVDVAGSVTAHQVVGGTLKLGEQLDCRVVGARMGTATVVVAAPPAYLCDLRRSIADERGTIQTHLERLSPRLREASAALQDPRQARRPDVEAFRKALELSAQLSERDAELAKKERAIAEQLTAHRPSICAHEMIHTGVVIQLGGSRLTIREPYPPGLLLERQGAIQVLPVP